MHKLDFSLLEQLSSSNNFNFLENKDSQINHEPLECLGPLKKF